MQRLHAYLDLHTLYALPKERTTPVTIINANIHGLVAVPLVETKAWIQESPRSSFVSMSEIVETLSFQIQTFS